MCTYLFLFYFIFQGYVAECRACNKWFSSQSTLTKHRIWHHKNELPGFIYNCEQCPYGSNKLSNMKKHLAVHNPNRPYSCFICGNRFQTLQTFKGHQLIHEGEDKIYFC